jgi:hypothetical protein
LPLRRRIAEESHDIGTGIAAWYCEAAAEKGEEVNPALIVFLRTKQRSKKPKKLAAAWRRREINHHSTSRSLGSVRETERDHWRRERELLRLCRFDAGRLRIGDFFVVVVCVFFVSISCGSAKLFVVENVEARNLGRRCHDALYEEFFGISALL